MSFPVINPMPQFFDSSGSPLSSGTIEFRNPADDTFINSYPTADDADAQTNANDNPLTLNARGEAPNGLYLEDGVKYKIVLKDSDTDPVWTEDDVRCPVFSAGSIGNQLYPRTTAEIAAAITPTAYQYEEGDSRRYGATFDGSTDDSAAHQLALDVLAQKGTGTWRISGGTSRAQGLVCRASNIEIVCDGRLKPVSNVSAATIIQFGEDSSSTTLLRVSGNLRVGDPSGVLSTWSNIIGIKLERATSFDFRVDGRGLGVFMDLAGKGAGVQMCTFHLDDVTNCKVGIRFNPDATLGWANENLFIGGRFGENTGTWESGVAYIQAVDNGGSGVNGNVFLKPAFEGVGRVVDFDNAFNNHIMKARWEGGTFSGVEGTDYEAVLFKQTADCLRNSFEITQGQDMVLSNSKDHGAATRNSDGVFVFASTDKRIDFRRGMPIILTVSAVNHTVFVTSTAFTAGDTFVYVSRPIVTAAPTAVIVPRVQDEGTASTWKFGDLNIAIVGTSSVTGPNESTEFGSQAHLRSHWVVNSQNVDYPFMVYCRGGDQATGHRFYEVRDRFQALKAWMGDEGETYCKKFSLDNKQTPIASRPHIADPSGGATQDAEARTAINAILATLEEFGFHLTA